MIGNSHSSKLQPRLMFLLLYAWCGIGYGWRSSHSRCTLSHTIRSTPRQGCLFRDGSVCFCSFGW